jgi:hypothetical protein
MKKSKARIKQVIITDADVKRVLRLLRNAQFSTGKKTDSVKLIRKDRSQR